MSVINRLLGVARPSASSVLVVDRIACAGHGICAHIVNAGIELDDWGYPILREAAIAPGPATAAIKLCPAQALRWLDRPATAPPGEIGTAPGE